MVSGVEWSSREPRTNRSVSASPGKRTSTTMPGPALPSVGGRGRGGAPAGTGDDPRGLGTAGEAAPHAQAGPGLAVGGRRLAALRVAEQLFGLGDAGLLLPLPLLGRVVPAVLLEVALFAG